ncbi:MAG TPA: hypothetical protein VJ964_14205 [Balneolaceae bacterium]|nr:hypothetical protein [Balneolaceae bacterium]
MDILFWSGGKDAYLALQFYRQEHPEAVIKLLTTYDETDEIVPHQRIKLEDIRKQAASLGLELILVPLPPDCPNDIYLERVKKALKNIRETIDHLIFGDWYLQDIREWRENVFGDMGYSCVFPIWKKNIHELLPVLLFKPITVEISAVKEEFQPLIRVGETFDQAFVSQLLHLPEDIDPMGEKGEFHTKVVFKDLDKSVR